MLPLRSVHHAEVGRRRSAARARGGTADDAQALGYSYAHRVAWRVARGAGTKAAWRWSLIAACFALLLSCTSPIRGQIGSAMQSPQSLWDGEFPGPSLLAPNSTNVAGLSASGMAVPLANSDLPIEDPRQPIAVRADRANRWTEGVYDVWCLDGNCSVAQGATHARGDRAVLWVERGGQLGSPPTKVVAYLEGRVQVESLPTAATSTASGRFDAGQPPPTANNDQWLGRFVSTSLPIMQVPVPGGDLNPRPAVYQNAVAARNRSGGYQPPSNSSAYNGLRPVAATTTAPQRGAITRTQYAEFGAPSPTPVLPSGTRRVRTFPRSDVASHLDRIPDPQGTGSMVIGTSGWNIIIDGVELMGEAGSIDISTDRFVIWTAGTPGAGETLQNPAMPLEIYMEGNVVFRQGNRIIQAQSMYYDVRQKVGVVLAAELLTPLPSPVYPGLVRLRANVLRQVDQDRYVAEDAGFTTSRFGLPSFEIRSGQVVLEDSQHPEIDVYSGAPAVDPRTGEPRIQHEQRLTARNDFIYAEDIPIFYWPVFSSDLERGDFYVTRLQFKEDSVFGAQFDSQFDAYQLLGIRNPPKGTKWDVDLDYYSKRGIAGGSEVRYDRDHLFDIPGKTTGFYKSWFIDDTGIDNLGRDRRAIGLEDGSIRGRVLAEHRQMLPNDWQIAGEFGVQSDRNFLEEYFLREFDELKDESTDVELRRNFDNSSFTITGAFRTNQFYTETQWLPRLDHFWLGQPLLGDNFTWYEHTNLGYANQNEAEVPTDPTDASKFTNLPWESPNLNGQRVATRQEVDWPVQLGPVKVVPYALGELANWGEDLTHNDFNRAYGIVGLRASIPFWAVDPTIQSDLFNVHGVAHKVDLSADVSLQQATGNLASLPLYDQIDDESIQHFERRFAFNTYGMPPGVGFPTGMPEFPAKFDPRYYLLRRGSGEWVTGPTEIAGDLTVIRLDADQRWQTKRGPPGDQHIIDWITLDTEMEIYPDAKQNFGTVAGLFDYDFHWFVGDRVTIVSSGAADFFSDGLEEISVGAFFNRPPRGNLYVGFYSLNGAIRSNVIATSWSYRMSPKWAATFGSSFDVSPSLNIGQSLSVTRIGESFLTTVGFNVDASRGTVGASLLIEPRALGRERLVKQRGLEIPPAGVYGLE
jgi:hypothetical protein